MTPCGILKNLTRARGLSLSWHSKLFLLSLPRVASPICHLGEIDSPLANWVLALFHTPLCAKGLFLSTLSHIRDYPMTTIDISKRIRPIITTLLLLLFSATANPAEIKSEARGTVYICTGKYAKRYHAKKSCRGLQNCQGNVVAIDISRVGDRTPCKICKP